MKLSKGDLAERATLVARLRAEHADLSAAIDDFNETMAVAKEKLTGAINTYNAVLADVYGFLDNLADDVGREIEEKSDKWQDSDVGHAANHWRNAIEGIASAFDDQVSEPELPDIEAPEEKAGLLDELPETPDEA